jgi:uncharacterized membrane protein YdbT with pleckstrin-like domain
VPGEETALTPPPPPSSEPERVLFEGRPAIVPSLGVLAICVLTLGLATLYFWIRASAVHYRITTERVVVERGLFSKRMNQIDVYRINDYVVEIPFGQRILGTGNIALSAMDKSTPELVLGGLKTDVRALYEELRHATENQKRRRGVRMVDYE